MNFLQRPLHNIKTIELTQIIFVGGGLLIFIMAALPLSSYVPLGGAIEYLFSVNTMPVIDTSNMDAIEVAAIRQQQQAFELMNLAKTTFWIMTLLLILMFLFKKPNVRTERDETNELDNER